MWLVFVLVIKKLYKKYKDDIQIGKTKIVRALYFFVKETMLKIHETIFGMAFYTLLLQFQSIDFHTVIGVFSYVSSVLLCIYMAYAAAYAWKKLNNDKLSK
jgi:hypothetical protein